MRILADIVRTSSWRRTGGRSGRRRSSSTPTTPSQARGQRAGALSARHPQPPPSPGALGSAPLTHASPDVHAPSGAATASAQTPAAWRTCPLVHWTSNLHGAPGAAAFAGPHTPSSPETLSSARQRSLAAQVRSQQIPSSQMSARALVRAHRRPGRARLRQPPSCPPSTWTPASARPASRFSTTSEKNRPRREAGHCSAPTRARSAASEMDQPNRSACPSLATSLCSSVQAPVSRRRRPRRDRLHQRMPDESAVAGERDGVAEPARRSPSLATSFCSAVHELPLRTKT